MLKLQSKNTFDQGNRCLKISFDILFYCRVEYVLINLEVYSLKPQQITGTDLNY